MAAETTDIDLSDPDFWRRTRAERFAAFDLLRREMPVSWQAPPLAWAPKGAAPPRGYWAVTSYDAVRTVSRDPATFGSGAGVMLFDNLAPEDRRLNDGWVGMDAPDHTRLRRLVSGAFTPRMAQRIEHWIREEVVGCIDSVEERGQGDFFADVAAPLPVRVICSMLGVPPSDREEVMRLTAEGVHFSAEVPFEQTLGAIRSVHEYAKALAGRRRNAGGDDLISSLVHAELDGAPLSDDEIASTFWVLITGGSDTTSTTAAHGVIAFSEFPGEWEKLASDPKRFLPTAVEEMLRWATPVLCFRRTAWRDTAVAGIPVREGDNLVVFYQSANRDETVFREPYRFDIARQPNPHLTFGGGGPHFCIGAALARLQLRVLFEELVIRLPGLALCEPPRYVPGPFLDTVASVPCRFGRPSSLPRRVRAGK